MLTFLLGSMSVLASWIEIQEGVGFFHLNLLRVLAGIAGAFLAMDLFLFYFAWELMLVPMYFLIAIWGHERRLYAAVKFFLFTQLGVYQKSRILTAVAAVGILASTFYALKFVQYAFHGPNDHHWALLDLGVREAIIFTPMIIILLWLGLHPRPVFSTFNPAMETLQQHAEQTLQALRR